MSFTIHDVASPAVKAEAQELERDVTDYQLDKVHTCSALGGLGGCLGHPMLLSLFKTQLIILQVPHRGEDGLQIHFRIVTSCCACSERLRHRLDELFKL